MKLCFFLYRVEMYWLYNDWPVWSFMHLSVHVPKIQMSIYVADSITKSCAVHFIQPRFSSSCSNSSLLSIWSRSASNQHSNVSVSFATQIYFGYKKSSFNWNKNKSISMLFFSSFPCTFGINNCFFSILCSFLFRSDLLCLPIRTYTSISTLSTVFAVIGRWRVM